VVRYSFFYGLCVLWWGALTGSWDVVCFEGRAVAVEGVVVTCSSAQVAVEYSVSAGGLLIVS